MKYEVREGKYGWEIFTSTDPENGVTWEQAVALLAGMACCNDD